jgi:hypothetical protein
MPVQFARPDVATLMLRVYDRALHPEFFDCHGLVVLECGALRVHLRLCSAGHLLCVRRKQLVLTEAITEKNQSLPPQGCVLQQKVRGCRTRSLPLPEGVRYDIGCQLETLEPELFLRMHEELRSDCAHADLAYEFPSPNRFSPGALSVVSAAVNRTSVMLHAFHTFPDHCAIIKTQTLFEWD